MRLSLFLFAASVVISLCLTVFDQETRDFFRGHDRTILIDEGSPELFLTKRDVVAIGQWSESESVAEIFSDYPETDPALFFNTFYLTNIGSEDIVDGVVLYGEGFSTDGLISARIRMPLPHEPIGQIDPRRFAWNDFEEESVGYFAFEVPVLRPGETLTVQVISDEFGAVVPTFRAANVRIQSRIQWTVDRLRGFSGIDWFKIIRFLSLVLLAGSTFYLGRNFSDFRCSDIRDALPFWRKQEAKVDD